MYSIARGDLIRGLTDDVRVHLTAALSQLATAVARYADSCPKQSCYTGLNINELLGFLSNLRPSRQHSPTSAARIAVWKAWGNIVQRAEFILLRRLPKELLPVVHEHEVFFWQQLSNQHPAPLTRDELSAIDSFAFLINQLQSTVLFSVRGRGFVCSGLQRVSTAFPRLEPHISRLLDAFHAYWKSSVAPCCRSGYHARVGQQPKKDNAKTLLPGRSVASRSDVDASERKETQEFYPVHAKVLKPAQRQAGGVQPALSECPIRCGYSKVDHRHRDTLTGDILAPLATTEARGDDSELLNTCDSPHSENFEHRAGHDVGQNIIRSERFDGSEAGAKNADASAPSAAARSDTVHSHRINERKLRKKERRHKEKQEAALHAQEDAAAALVRSDDVSQRSQTTEISCPEACKPSKAAGTRSLKPPRGPAIGKPRVIGRADCATSTAGTGMPTGKKVEAPAAEDLNAAVREVTVALPAQPVPSAAVSTAINPLHPVPSAAVSTAINPLHPVSTEDRCLPRDAVASKTIDSLSCPQSSGRNQASGETASCRSKKHAKEENTPVASEDRALRLVLLESLDEMLRPSVFVACTHFMAVSCCTLVFPIVLGIISLAFYDAESSNSNSSEQDPPTGHPASGFPERSPPTSSTLIPPSADTTDPTRQPDQQHLDLDEIKSKLYEFTANLTTLNSELLVEPESGRLGSELSQSRQVDTDLLDLCAQTFRLLGVASSLAPRQGETSVQTTNKPQHGGVVAPSCTTLTDIPKDPPRRNRKANCQNTTITAAPTRRVAPVEKGKTYTVTLKSTPNHKATSARARLRQMYLRRQKAEEDAKDSNEGWHVGSGHVTNTASDERPRGDEVPDDPPSFHQSQSNSHSSSSKPPVPRFDNSDYISFHCLPTTHPLASSSLASSSDSPPLHSSSSSSSSLISDSPLSSRVSMRSPSSVSDSLLGSSSSISGSQASSSFSIFGSPSSSSSSIFDSSLSSSSSISESISESSSSSSSSISDSSSSSSQLVSDSSSSSSQLVSDSSSSSSHLVSDSSSSSSHSISDSSIPPYTTRCLQCSSSNLAPLPCSSCSSGSLFPALYKPDVPSSQTSPLGVVDECLAHGQPTTLRMGASSTNKLDAVHVSLNTSLLRFVATSITVFDVQGTSQGWSLREQSLLAQSSDLPTFQCSDELCLRHGYLLVHITLLKLTLAKDNFAFMENYHHAWGIWCHLPKSQRRILFDIWTNRYTGTHRLLLARCWNKVKNHGPLGLGPLMYAKITCLRPACTLPACPNSLLRKLFQHMEDLPAGVEMTPILGPGIGFNHLVAIFFFFFCLVFLAVVVNFFHSRLQISAMFPNWA